MKTWVEDRAEMEAILERLPVGRLGLVADGEPYIVPLNYAYQDGCIYFHTGLEGRKLDALRKSPRVCFEVDELLGVIPHEQGCLFTTHYRSVIAWGAARLVASEAKKMKALELLLAKYGAGKEYEPPLKESLELVSVCEVKVEKMTGKANLPDEE